MVNQEKGSQKKKVKKKMKLLMAVFVGIDQLWGFNWLWKFPACNMAKKKEHG